MFRVQERRIRDCAFMDHIGLKRSDSSIIDMEMGRTLSEDDDVVQGNAVKKKLGRLRSGFLTGSARSTGDLNSIEDGMNSGENLKILVSQVSDESLSSLGNKMAKDNRKQKNLKKPPKPPRPPRGPSWETADMDLVRQASELARLKHARNERLKALKMKRAEKASSSSINILAMFITILFFLVIIFQGFLASRV